MKKTKCECPARKVLEVIARRRCEKTRFDKNGCADWISKEFAYCDPCSARAALSAPCPCEGLREESEGRRITLFEKADELATQWRRAEQAEAERNQLRAKLKKLKNASTSR